MLGKSHLFYGTSAGGVLALALAHPPQRLLGALAGLLVGLVATMLNVVSRTLSWLVRLVAGGHREGSHCLPVWAVLSAVAYAVTVPLLGPWAAVGFCAGYLSHLAADGCTRAGIPLVPYTAVRLHLLPPLLRIRTGSAGEAVFTVTYIVALVAVVYLFLAQNVMVLIRSA